MSATGERNDKERQGKRRQKIMSTDRHCIIIIVPGRSAAENASFLEVSCVELT